MPDMGAIAAGLSALQAAGDIAKSMMGLRDTAMVQGKVIELQSAILSAQSSALSAQAEQAALLQEIDKLKKEMARLEAWETEKQKYKLVQLADGVFAYSLKEDATGGEPPHEICANCYQQGFISILQREHRFPGRTEHAVCAGCGADLVLSGGRRPDQPAQKVISRRPK